MTRGRKPDPVAVKRSNGQTVKRSNGQTVNPEKRRLVDDLSFVSGAGSDRGAAGTGIAAPSWLTDGARDIWNTHAPIQQRLKLLGEADVIALGRYCEMFRMWIGCKQNLDENGMTYEVESNHGRYRRPNPSFVMMKWLRLDLLGIEDRYGMNPAERQRLFASRAGSADRNPGDQPAFWDRRRKVWTLGVCWFHEQAAAKAVRFSLPTFI